MSVIKVNSFIVHSFFFYYEILAIIFYSNTFPDTVQAMGRRWVNQSGKRMKKELILLIEYIFITGDNIDWIDCSFLKQNYFII